MLLADYSGRLAAEIDDRRQLTRTLTVFLQSQKDGLVQNEQKLEVRKSLFLSFTLLSVYLRLPDVCVIIIDSLCSFVCVAVC